jgi:hypothetical protein
MEVQVLPLIICSKIISALEALRRGVRSLMNAVYIGILGCCDVKSPIHAAGQAWISLDFHRNDVLSSRVTPDLLQRDTLELGFGDERFEHRTHSSRMAFTRPYQIRPAS